MRTGLKAVLADTPVRAGYAQALVGWQPSAGLTGRLEAGWRPIEPLSIFGFGEYSSKLGPAVGAGVRVEW